MEQPTHETAQLLRHISTLPGQKIKLDDPMIDEVAKYRLDELVKLEYLAGTDLVSIDYGSAAVPCVGLNNRSLILTMPGREYLTELDHMLDEERKQNAANNADKLEEKAFAKKLQTRQFKFSLINTAFGFVLGSLFTLLVEHFSAIMRWLGLHL